MSREREVLQKNAEIINYCLGYNPSAILMNSKNYNYTLRDYCNETDLSSLKDAISSLLKANGVYERSYSMVGARGFCNLTSELKLEYDRYIQEYNGALSKAKSAVISGYIRLQEVISVEVYEAVVAKYNALYKKKIKSSITAQDDFKLQYYKAMLNNAGWSLSYNLFNDTKAYEKGTRNQEVFIKGKYLLMPIDFLLAVEDFVVKYTNAKMDSKLELFIDGSYSDTIFSIVLNGNRVEYSNDVCNERWYSSYEKLLSILLNRMSKVKKIKIIVSGNHRFRLEAL